MAEGLLFVCSDVENSKANSATMLASFANDTLHRLSNVYDQGWSCENDATCLSSTLYITASYTGYTELLV